MMDVQLTDISLFAVSFTACLYCFVLSRRLKRLQDTKDGLGAMIVAFSKSISDMSSSTKDTNLRAKQIAQNLTTAIHAADISATKITELLETLDTKEAQLTHSIENLTNNVNGDLQSVIDEAKLYAHEITDLLREIKTLPAYTKQVGNSHSKKPSHPSEIEAHDLF